MVSVAMTTFNGEKYITRQLSSVLMNLGNDDEVVISDDGSIDGTLNIINSFHDNRIRVVKGPQKGLVKNFENAIIECKGDYIFLCDQDDYWYEGKVNKVLKCFKENDCILVEHNARVVAENGDIIYPSFFDYRRVRRGVIKNSIRNTYHGSLMAFVGSIKSSLIPFCEEGCFHDQWIGIIADYLGKVYFHDEILMDYVRHGENNSSFINLPIKRQISDRVKLARNLVVRIKSIKGKRT